MIEQIVLTEVHFEVDSKIAPPVPPWLDFHRDMW